MPVMPFCHWQVAYTYQVCAPKQSNGSQYITWFLCRLPQQGRHIGIALLSDVVCCENWLTFGSNLSHALMDFNRSCIIYATWEPSFVDEVKYHISRSKVIRGQVVRWAENLKVASFLEVRLEPNLVYRYNMGSFVCSCGQRSLEVSCKIDSKCKIHLI